MSKHDSAGAMAAAWFGTPGTNQAVEAVFGKPKKTRKKKAKRTDAARAAQGHTQAAPSGDAA